MICVPGGSRLVLRTGDGRRIEALTLVTTKVEDQGRIPVLAAPDSGAFETGTAEVPTEAGLVLVSARLLSRDGLLELNMPIDPRPIQRRAHARDDRALELHGVAVARPLPGGHTLGPPVSFRGLTRDISTGGLGALVEMETAGARLPSQFSELFVELDLGGPRPAGVVMQVVSMRSDLLRARFVYLSPADRAHLAAEYG